MDLYQWIDSKMGENYSLVISSRLVLLYILSGLSNETISKLLVIPIEWVKDIAEYWLDFCGFSEDQSISIWHHYRNHLTIPAEYGNILSNYLVYRKELERILNE